MVRTADVIKGVNQSVLVLRIESNVEIDGKVSRRVTQVRPVVWERIPLVLHIHVFPTWCEGRCEAVEESGDEDEKHREYVTAHDIYYNATNPCKGRNRRLEGKRARRVETHRLWLGGGTLWSISALN